ncbi:MAG: ROK family protein [Rothia sp. (in: high G+C Gram-positive bacteria)]|nr:ROK family protein [Rothia sp. (in: high G+C Gram-positive bacteria)]
MNRHLHEISPAPASDRLFFSYLLKNGPSSRAEIAAKHDLSRPTASEAALRLSERKYIKTLEKDAGASGKRGRVPELYDIADDIGSVLTVVVNVLGVTVSLYDLRGNLLEQKYEDHVWETHAKSYEAVEKLLDSVIALAHGPFLAATAAVMTSVNPITQQLIALPDSPYTEEPVDFFGLLSHKLNCPVLVDETINWALLHEITHGVARNSPATFGVHLAEGVQGAFALGNTIYRGASGRAGAMGYIQSHHKQLNQALKELGVPDRTNSEIYGVTYLDYEKTAEKILANVDGKEEKEYLDLSVEAIVNGALILDPASVVLTGPMTCSRKFIEVLQSAIEEKMLWDSTEVLISDDGADAISLGTACGANLLALTYMGLEDPSVLGRDHVPPERLA